MTFEKTLSIIIVSYNAQNLLKKCIASIYLEKQISFQVIVVDNNSQDGSAEMVKEHFPEAILIKNSKNEGFARANNIGIPHATGEYILLLNPDTELLPNTLRDIIHYMDKRPDVSATGCKILYPDGSTQVSCGYFPTPFSHIFGGQTINILYRKFFPGKKFIGACGIVPDELDKEQEVETLLGAFILFRHEIINQIGGLFDENMFVYFEECDFFQRIRNAGGKITFTPEPTIIHHAGACTVSVARSVSYYITSLEYYLKKHYRVKHLAIFRIAAACSALLKCGTLLLTIPFSRSKSLTKLQKRILWQWHTLLFYVKLLPRQNKPLSHK